MIRNILVWLNQKYINWRSNKYSYSQKRFNIKYGANKLYPTAESVNLPQCEEKYFFYENKVFYIYILYLNNTLH